MEVDAIDNGVSEADEMRYYVRSGLSSRVGRLNTNWNAPKTVSQHDQFKKAMKICEEEFLWNLKGSVMVKMPAYDIVKEALDKREAFHPSKEIVYMETACPWKDHLFDIEEE